MSYHYPGGGGYGYHGMHGYHGHYGHHGRPWFRHRFWRGGQGSMFPDPQVQSAQACLAQSVDPSVPQDGIMGPQTRQAIRQFQMQQQMPPTGRLDPDTMSALQNACSPQQAAPPPPPPPPPPPQAQGGPPPGGKHSQGQAQEAFLGDFLNPLGPLGGAIGGLFQGGGSQPPPPPDDGGGGGDPWRRRRRRFGRWHHETENEFPGHQQEAFLGDFLNPLGPLGGVIGGLFQGGGGSQPQPPPPPDDGGGGEPWRWRHHRFGRWHHETENEFPFERPIFDFHRHDRFPEERWRWDHDRRPWWDHDREGEVRVERPVGGARPSVDRPNVDRPNVDRHVVDRPVVDRTVVDRTVVERPVIDRTIVERPIIERPVIERPVIERPVFAGPGFARPGYARPGFDFRGRDRFPFARDRWGWNRDRWFGRPWGRWGWRFPGGGPQVAWAQSCLAQVLGSWVLQDGIMGPNTQGAIRTFQERQQLPVTGVLDGVTVNALQAACGSQMPT
jgi:peptidoglycan hydrolase-like protein with peptidoglycan-binding domain